MGSNAQYAKQMAETRKWAEAEIGRPKLAVVGGWNDAYPKMMKSALNENSWRVKDLLPSEQKVPKWWRYTGRVDLIETCNRAEQCEKKYYSKTGWTKSGIKKDFDALDVILEKMEQRGDRDSKMRQNRLMHWASLCGELCCPWRERHGLACENEYASDPFAYTVYNAYKYQLLNTYWVK